MPSRLAMPKGLAKSETVSGCTVHVTFLSQSQALFSCLIIGGRIRWWAKKRAWYPLLACMHQIFAQMSKNSVSLFPHICLNQHLWQKQLTEDWQLFKCSFYCCNYLPRFIIVLNYLVWRTMLSFEAFYCGMVSQELYQTWPGLIFHGHYTGQ